MKLPKGVTKHRGKYQVSAGSGETRRTTTVETIADGVDARTILKAELCIPRTRKTLGDAYEQTLRECWSRRKSGAKLARNAEMALEFFGRSMPLDQLNRTDLVSYEETLRREGNTDATINRKLAAVSKILHIAYEHGWVQALPVIHRHKEGNGRIRYLTSEEERTLVQLCHEWGKTDHRDAIQVLLDTGMRPDELFKLEKRDINFTQHVIHIFDNKTSHPRSLPMTRRVRDILFARTVTQMTPFPFDNNWMIYVWNRLKVMMGLTGDAQFVPYACRHTCATRLLQRGMTLPELQQWMGHKSLHMTMRYAHLSPTALMKGAALLEQQEVSYEHSTSIGVDGVVNDRVRD